MLGDAVPYLGRYNGLCKRSDESISVGFSHGVKSGNNNKGERSMKKVLVLVLMLMSSICFAKEINTIARATADGYATTQGKAVRVISITYLATSIGDLEIYNGTTQVATLEHVVYAFGPFEESVAPIFTNGVYLNFEGVTSAEATVVYQQLE